MNRSGCELISRKWKISLGLGLEPGFCGHRFYKITFYCPNCYGLKFICEERKRRKNVLQLQHVGTSLLLKFATSPLGYTKFLSLLSKYRSRTRTWLELIISRWHSCVIPLSLLPIDCTFKVHFRSMNYYYKVGTID